MAASRADRAQVIANARRQTAWAWDGNVPELLAVPCRTPGCDQVVKRTAGAGRTRWFHSAACQKEFHKRRHDLDHAIEGLIEARQERGRSKRDVRDVESEISRLLGVRSAFISPTEWVTTRLDGGSAQVEHLIRELQLRRLEMRYIQDPCPVCEGTGTVRRAAIPVATTFRKGRNMRARREQVRRTLAEIDKLTYMAPALGGEPAITNAYELIRGVDPYRDALPDSEV